MKIFCYLFLVAGDHKSNARDFKLEFSFMKTDWRISIEMQEADRDLIHLCEYLIDGSDNFMQDITEDLVDEKYLSNFLHNIFQIFFYVL